MIPASYKGLALVVACLLALLASFFFGWYVNGLRHEKAELERTAKAREAFDKAIAAEKAKSAKLDARITELLDRPPAVRTVKEVIRANPSTCTRPAAVTDSLRSEVASANQAIAASRGGKVLQRNADQAESSD